MIITLNGYPLNDGSNGAWLNTSIAGLETPTIRTSSGNYAGRDGGYIGAQYFSARAITIQGTVFSSNVAVLEQTRRELQSALLSQRTGAANPVTVDIVTNAGTSYTVYANLLDFQMPIGRSIFKSPFKIELLASDPTIYSSQNAVVPITVPKVSGGGFTMPFDMPIVFAAGAQPTTVTNEGTVAVYPIIALTGLMTNPVITNTTTELFLGLNITTASTDEVIINMQQRTVLLNGSSIFGDVTAGSSWWSLMPGGNAISLTSASGSDTVSSTVTWQSGYMGI